MQRKNVILMSTVILAVAIFTLPEIFSMFPGWPGYGVRSFQRWNCPVLALTHALVIDGTGAAPFEDVTLIIAEGKIRSIGNASTTLLPPGAKVLNLAGYTIIPGLVGMHDHMFYPSGRSGGYKEMGFSFPRLYLASGVTTIRTAGGILPSADLRLKSQIDKGWLAGPKMYVSGPYFDGGLSPDQVRKLVDVWADKGATSFKAYMYLSHSSLAAAIDEAHKRGLKLTGHLCAVGFREAAALGIDNLEHGLVVDTEFDPGKKPNGGRNRAVSARFVQCSRAGG
jgi:imidazolonepropionase-like amidohydrolase